MKKYSITLYLLLCVFGWSCGESNKEKEETAAELEKKTAEEKRKEEEKKLLTELIEGEEVEAKLSRFGELYQDSIVLISTNLGDIKVRLYPETKLHRANFVRLVKRGFYNGRFFHRVVPDFVAQGDGTDERLPVKIGHYRVPSEFMPKKYFHKKGALAMARHDVEENPEKKSDSHEFYIVSGGVKTKPALNAIAREHHLDLTPQQVQTYMTVGGEPHLDGNYTVFGEVIEGLEVVDKITSLEIDKRGWPKYENVTIQMSLPERDAKKETMGR